MCCQNFHASDQKIDVYQYQYIYIYIYRYILICLPNIYIYWSENENNGLKNGKKFKVKVLYSKSELKQLDFRGTHGLHN